MGGSFPHFISTDESYPKEKRRRKREKGKRNKKDNKRRENGKGDIGKEMKMK